MSDTPTLACDNCGAPMLGERKHWGAILVCERCYRFASMTPDRWKRDLAAARARIAQLEDAAQQVTPIAPESLIEQSKLRARVAMLEAERDRLKLAVFTENELEKQFAEACQRIAALEDAIRRIYSMVKYRTEKEVRDSIVLILNDIDPNLCKSLGINTDGKNPPNSV